MIADWEQLQTHILQFEQQGLVTRTFRRLDPERQQIIINAILDEAVDKGPTSLNIKRVAERAGVSVGSLYTYFGSRDGLLAFAVELCVQFMRDTFESYRPILVAMPLREALTAYLLGGMEWSEMQIGLVQFFARAAYHSDSQLSEQVVRPIATVLQAIVREMLFNAIERGEVRPDIDVEATTRVLNAMLIAIGDSFILSYLNTYFQVSDNTMPPERVLEAVVALVLQGIGTAA